MPRHLTMCLFACLALLTPLISTNARAVEVQFHKADGAPVNWGTNTIYFGNPPKIGPRFETELGANGMLVTAGLYKIRRENGKTSSPDSQVRVQRGSITIDARLIDESLRCASAVAWSQGRLYVAETHSNDCLDKYIYRVKQDGSLGERFETVVHPAALVVAKDVAYVLGAEELAAIDLATGQRRWSMKTDALGGGAEQMALAEDTLYVSCPELNQIARIDVAQGKPSGHFDLPAAQPSPKGKWRHQRFPVAANPAGSLLVATAGELLELTPQGKQVRVVAQVKDALALAVGPDGEIAIAASPGQSAFYVLRMDSTGKPLLKIMKTAWNDFGKESCDCRYFSGLLGKVSWIGGLAFDDAGNLYVGDRNDVPKTDSAFLGLGADMGNDGGIVKTSRAGDMVARFASRFTDGTIIQSRMADRERRDPMQRTRALFSHGGKGAIVVYGDSITQIGGDWNGGASDSAHNWTMLLPSLIAARHPAAKVAVDARGIGGNVVYNGLCRAPQPEHVELDATLYLLEFGTNDLNRPWVNVERYADGLREFVKMLFVYTDADVALVTTGPLIGQYLHDPAEYHKAIFSVAAQYRLPVVDMTHAVDVALAGRDYTTLHLGTEPNRKREDPHPNTAGHQVWAQAAVDALENALKAKP